MQRVRRPDPLLVFPLIAVVLQAIQTAFAAIGITSSVGASSKTVGVKNAREPPWPRRSWATQRWPSGRRCKVSKCLFLTQRRHSCIAAKCLSFDHLVGAGEQLGRP